MRGIIPVVSFDNDATTGREGEGKGGPSKTNIERMAGEKRSKKEKSGRNWRERGEGSRLTRNPANFQSVGIARFIWVGFVPPQTRIFPSGESVTSNCIGGSRQRSRSSLTRFPFRLAETWSHHAGKNTRLSRVLSRLQIQGTGITRAAFSRDLSWREIIGISIVKVNGYTRYRIVGRRKLDASARYTRRPSARCVSY